MGKLILILVAALVVEATGVVLLSKGLKEIGSMGTISVASILQLVHRGATNPNLLLGVVLEAAFFGVLLYLLSTEDVSFVWPLTSLGFVLTTLAARFLLREEVSYTRWGGVVLIMVGAGLITWSEKQKERLAASKHSTSAASTADWGK